MKTETVELTRSEIQYLMEIVKDHIDSGVYWGNQDKFHQMQNNVFDKLQESMSLIDPDMKGFDGDY